MAESTKSSQRVVQLDYIKAFSILMVVLTHCSFTAAQRERPVFVLLINMAMPLFMLVYGYVRSLSTKKPLGNWKAYVLSQLKKLYDILLPYGIALGLELLLMQLLNGHLPANLFRLLWEEGGIGPGSYYVPMLLQLWLLFPVFQVCFRKNAPVTTVMAIVAFVAYEFFANRYIDDKLYRLLCFRYIPFLVAGMNMAKYRDGMAKWKNAVFALATISLVWLYFIVYRDYVPPIFSQWSTTAGPVVFLAMSLMIGMLYYVKPLPGFIGTLLSRIGQASYYIFLPQLVWYGVPLAPKSLTGLPAAIVNLIFTTWFGVVFQQVERWLAKKLFASRCTVK